jgi:hypothetical protein
MTIVLHCIQRAFTDEALKKLTPQDCINISVKMQYYVIYYSWLGSIETFPSSRLPLRLH